MTRPAFTARAMLVRGLLAGLLAGLVTFGVAHQIGEPSVDAAIAFEESASQPDPGAPAEEELVSRDTQSTWGLLTASTAVSVAIGGALALAAGFGIGRLGRLSPTQATAVVGVGAFVALGLVPWLAYPSNPPGVGSPDTIGSRTLAYFGLLDLSLLAAVLAAVVAVKLSRSIDGYAAALVATVGYLAVVVTAAVLLPGDAPLGDVPADVLWDFRFASLMSTVTMWVVLVGGLVGAVRLLERRVTADTERRALAASL